MQLPHEVSSSIIDKRRLSTRMDLAFFHSTCSLGLTQSMGTVVSSADNAAESFFGQLKRELRGRSAGLADASKTTHKHLYLEVVESHPKNESDSEAVGQDGLNFIGYNRFPIRTIMKSSIATVPMSRLKPISSYVLLSLLQFLTRNKSKTSLTDGSTPLSRTPQLKNSEGNDGNSRSRTLLTQMNTKYLHFITSLLQISVCLNYPVI